MAPMNRAPPSRTALSACLLLALVGCGGGDNAGAPPPSGNPPPPSVPAPPNRAPEPGGERVDQLVEVGQAFSFDAAVGRAFVDPDGDPVTYAVSQRGLPRVALDGSQ